MIAWIALLAGCPGEATVDPCASIACLPWQICKNKACLPRPCATSTDCPAGLSCLNGSCAPNGATDARSDRLEAGTAAKDSRREASGGCGSCDDGDPCTLDRCGEGGVCEHETPVPSTCGNGTLEACEICEGEQPLGKDQLCFNCNQIGFSYFMYLASINVGNAFFSASGGEYDLLVTCNGNRVITWIGGNCEQGSLYAKSGGVGQKSVTISCTAFVNHNKSTYQFRCGPK